MIGNIFPPGLMALASSEIARYAASRTSIEGLQRPSGSLRYSATSLSVAENFNGAADIFMDKPDLQWLFLMNDDQVYAPDTLMRLLARMYDNNLDVVTGLYFARSVPFGPILFEKPALGDSILAPRRFVQPMDPDVIEIGACGDGCMLIKRAVIAAIDAPRWELGFGGFHDQSNHDMAFCAKIRRAGFKLHADLTVQIGHTMPMTVWPLRLPDGTWAMSFRSRVDSEHGLMCPAPTGEKVIV